MVQGTINEPAYYVSFGPHGPRAPINPPGTTPKIFAAVTALIGVAGLLFVTIRSQGELASRLFFLFESFSGSCFLFPKRACTAENPLHTYPDALALWS